MIGRDRVTYLYLIPTLYHDLLADPDFTDSDIRSVRKLGFAGAAMPERLLKRVNDLIITSGENVSPGEIESMVSLHQAVAEIAIVA